MTVQRFLGMLTVTAIIFSPTTIWGDEAGDLAEKAMKARGGDAARMAKMKNVVSTATGTMRIGKDDVKIRREIAATWPDNFLIVFSFVEGSTPKTVAISHSGDTGWTRTSGMPVEELGVDKLNDFLADSYGERLSTFLPLTEPGLKLTSLGKGRIGGETLVGLKVARRGWPEMSLYFDPTTMNLRKAQYRSREAGIPRNKEITFDGYKDFGGYQLPTKQVITIEGKELTNYGEIQYTLPETIDKKRFAKP
jgi:hypothetical protein